MLFYVQFKWYAPDNTVLMVWLGLGTKNTWLGLEKHHVRAYVVLSTQPRVENVQMSHEQRCLMKIIICFYSYSTFLHNVKRCWTLYRLVREGIHT